MEQNKKLRTKIGKLLSGSRKPDEGFAEVFDYEPKDFLEKQHGNIYFVVEVASGSKAAVDVGEAVINAIRDEFYDDLNRSVILSLESALRKANEELSDFASAGETDWIGKLNVVCAVISEEKLHLSKVGATEAYILRGSKITHISESVPTDEIEEKHPMKTFSSITSGKLEHHDKVLLSTSELFSHISLSGIKKILEENSPSDSMLKLKEVLKTEEGIGSIGTLIVEMVTEDEISEEQGEEMDEIWIEEPKPAQAAKDIASGAITGVTSFFQKIGDNIKNRVTPKENIDQAPEEPEIKEELEEKEPKEKEKLKVTKPQKQENFISFVGNYFKKFSFEDFIKDVKKVFSSLIKKAKEQTKSKYFKFLAGGVILLILSLGLFANSYYSTKNKNAAQAKLNEATQLYEDAKTALTYEARNEAKEYLEESKLLVTDILEGKYFKEEAQSLASKIDTSLKEAEGIFEVSPTQVTEISDLNPSQFVISDKNLFVLDKDSKKIQIINIENNEKETVELETNYTPLSIALQSRVNNVLVYTNGSEVFEIDTNSFEVNKATSAQGNFKKGDFIGTYLSNMYIVSREANQIYRYTRLATAFSSSSNYVLDNSVDIKNATSLAIPGTVLVLGENGNITKMLSGKKQEFAFINTPRSLENPVKIINTPDSERIYVLDKSMGIMVFKLDGSYEKTLSPKDTNDIKDFEIDEASGIIYLLASNKIFQLGK